MDLGTLNFAEKRSSRFKVNPVDSGGSGFPRQLQGIDNPMGPLSSSPTLVSYSENPLHRKSIPRIMPLHLHEEVDENIAEQPDELTNTGSRRASGSALPYSSWGDQYMTYDAKSYNKSLRHFTREALPRLDNYRNIMSIQAAYRPTLDDLHYNDLPAREKGIEEMPNESNDFKKDCEEGTGSTLKFGWVKGVFIRCLLNIWGVMLFLRLSWVTGQAGVGQALVIISFTALVTSITTLSMSAISTNGVVKGGGTYYMISRSLGAEFGASIGAIFSVANAVAIAMYTVGFAESLVSLLDSFEVRIVDEVTHSVRIIGTITIILLTCIVIVGMEWEAAAQIGLLVILVAAMFNFMLGSILGPQSKEELAKGFWGYNYSLFIENLRPAYSVTKEGQQDFFSVFAIFFPAATGILAGANISGDLEDPQKAIPQGTILAIIITTLSYMVFAVIAGATMAREATGNWTVPDYAVNHSREYIMDHSRDCFRFENGTSTCEFGLLNSFEVMELVSAWGPLIYAGCFAATLSSALASFVSAPKVFQALCNDKIYPYIDYFGKGFGKNNEPFRGYVLAFIIALACVLIGELNLIAPLISNFFLAAYALVNFSTFHASLIKPVGWRPTFKYYNMWLSLIGSILCVAVMFLISWITALLTIGVIYVLYMIVVYRKPDVNWGSTTQAQAYKSALSSAQQLNNVDEHVKNYRPQMLVLSGLPSHRPALVDFAYLITKHLSLMVCGQICKSNLNNRVRKSLIDKAHAWFKLNKTKAFFCPVDGMSFENGANSLLQAYGVGKLRPNILLMGYKSNWRHCSRQDLQEYFEVIHKALDLHLAVTVLRLKDDLDVSNVVAFEAEDISNPIPTPDLHKTMSTESIDRNLSFVHIPTNDTSGDSYVIHESKNEPSKKSKKSVKKDPSIIYKNLNGGDIPKAISENISQFKRKYKGGRIDVWWLYDDGGLTLLLPYIMNTRSQFSTCSLRVFALANHKDQLGQEQRNMASLLAKFRIDYSDLVVIGDINKKASEKSKKEFNSLVGPFMGEEGQDGVITMNELNSMKEKTNRHLRIHELLGHYSKESTFIVMTLPMPKKGMVSAPLYMAWLEMMTKDMPPFLLVRGNQSSVLTYYS